MVSGIFAVAAAGVLHATSFLHDFRSIIGSMKSKTSITLSTALLEDLDRIVGKTGNRSDMLQRQRYR